MIRSNKSDDPIRSVYITRYDCGTWNRVCRKRCFSSQMVTIVSFSVVTNYFPSSWERDGLLASFSRLWWTTPSYRACVCGGGGGRRRCLSPPGEGWWWAGPFWLGGIKGLSVQRATGPCPRCPFVSKYSVKVRQKWKQRRGRSQRLCNHVDLVGDVESLADEAHLGRTGGEPETRPATESRPSLATIIFP